MYKFVNIVLVLGLFLWFIGGVLLTLTHLIGFFIILDSLKNILLDLMVTSFIIVIPPTIYNNKQLINFKRSTIYVREKTKKEPKKCGTCKKKK
jgi:hypothetical protein